MTQSQVREYPHCYGCGSENSIGLRLELTLEGDELETEFVPSEEHAGWPGIVHGGIITSLLYEVMENLPHHQGVVTMMKTMETRFRRPAKTGEKITARSWLDERSDRTIQVSGELTGQGGQPIAQGKAVLVVLSDEDQARVGIA